MTLAAQAREQAREHPFIYEALRAGVLNYSAAARFLDIGDEETVAAALRRYGEELDFEPIEGTRRVKMKTGLGQGADGNALVTVGDTRLSTGEGSLTAILVTGDVSIRLFWRVLSRCEAEGIDIEATGATAETLIVVVGRRDGPNALQLAEAVCE